MSVLIWGSQTRTKELGPAGHGRCATCGQERPFKHVVEYRFNHLYYVFGFVSQKRYRRLCATCGRGEVLDAGAFESAVGRNPIPWFERFGCVSLLGGLAAAIGALALLMLLAPTPRNIPDLRERAGRGEPAAIERLLQEGKSGDAPSQEVLMDLYLNGQGVAQNDAEAFRWAKAAAGQGNARAEHTLGYLYEAGRGTGIDYAQAMHWYRQADAQGVAVSANNIGALYLRGLGVPADAAAAVRWFKRAAEGGDGGASFNLGARYLQGQGTPVDYVEARRWFAAAAVTQGDDARSHSIAADAKYELGLLYEQGQGVAADPVKALHYYEEASPYNAEAAQSLERLRAKLTSK